jgi:hypothetical protein
VASFINHHPRLEPDVLECPDFLWPLLDEGRDLIPVELEAGFLTKFDRVDFDLLGLVFDGFALGRD